MADVTKDVAPVASVQVEALVVLKIAKHCSSSFPSSITGGLVGLDTETSFEITNSFAFPGADSSSDHSDPHSATSIPRQKAGIAYQADMLRLLKEVNVDANTVGWYTSAAMGNFYNTSFIENQYHYQKDNAKAVALVHDVSRSSQGTLNLKAFRLTPVFMTAFKENKFTTETLQNLKLSFKEIVEEVPIVVHNSHLLTTFLHQLPQASSTAEIAMPRSLAEIEQGPQMPLYPSIDNLDLSIDPFLEKTCDLLLDSIENHTADLNNFQYYQRQLGREQAKITQWQTKRKAENAARAASNQDPLPEDEWQRLFKLPQEPSKLEGMLNAKQIEQYSKQVDIFSANISAKMFAVRDNLLPKAV